jgi:putative hydrolase of the HAD superfamily
MLKPKTITTIVFDLDDTLRFNDPHAHSFFCDYAESLSKPLNLEQRRASQRWEHSYWATSDDLLADLKAFGEGNETFWLNYSQRHLLALGLDPDEAQQLAPQAHAHMHQNYKPTSRVHPETLLALQTLRSSGYHVGLLTNRPKPAHAEMHAIGLDTYLDFFLTGSQLGAYKPHKENFENLRKFLNISTGEMIYVGDNYYADVVGARNAGVLPILLNWNGLYADVDCLEIKSIPELLTILQPEAISQLVQ